MARKRVGAEQIVTKLRQFEVLIINIISLQPNVNGHFVSLKRLRLLTPNRHRTPSKRCCHGLHSQCSILPKTHISSNISLDQPMIGWMSVLPHV